MEWHFDGAIGVTLYPDGGLEPLRLWRHGQSGRAQPESCDQRSSDYRRSQPLVQPPGLPAPDGRNIWECGRNQFLGPNLIDFDTSLFKRIRITEGLNLQFRAEAFNILNRANFGQPSIGVYAG